VIRPDAGITEGVELFIGTDQLPDLGACVRLDEAEGNFTDDSVTLIAPSPGIAADREKHN
jgi:hypothetical protein